MKVDELIDYVKENAQRCIDEWCIRENEYADSYAELDEAVDCIESLETRVIDAEAERNELLESLRRFGEHTEGCGYLDAEVSICDCGLSDALRGGR
jgi:hypothetical protein